MASKAVANHQVGARPQQAYHLTNRAEVVAAVRVGHHDVAAARGLDSRGERGAVAGARLIDHARASGAGYSTRPVGGPVVTHDDLAVQTVGGSEQRTCRRHTPSHRLLLIQARKDNADLATGSGGAVNVPFADRAKY